MTSEFQLPQKFIDGVVAHINADHRKEVLEIVHALAGQPWAQEATLLTVDTRGIDLLARAGEQVEQIRVVFDESLTTTTQFRPKMIALCQQARQRLDSPAFA